MSDNPFAAFRPAAPSAGDDENPFARFAKPRTRDEVDEARRKAFDKAVAEQTGKRDSAPPPPAFDPFGAFNGMADPAPDAATEMPYREQISRATGAIGRGADFLARQIANGATFGLADRFAGAMDAATGNAPSYSAGVDAQVARTRADAEANPVAAGAADLAGGLIGGGALMKNGVTLLRTLPKDAGFIRKALTFGAEGAGYGAAQGAGRTYSEAPGDYLDAARSGAATGAFIGAGLPAAGSALAGTYRLGSRLFGASPVEGMSRGAANTLRAAGAGSERTTLSLSDLGSDAMLADASPSLLGLTQGVASKPGPGRDVVAGALAAREAGANQRIGTVLDDLGPARAPSRIEAEISANREALTPAYEAALSNAKPVELNRLAASLDNAAATTRGDAQKAVQRVRAMLDDPATGALETSPRVLLETRKAVDGMLDGVTDGNVRRVLGEARRAIDAELAAKVPGIKEVDAKFAELARQSAALDRGGVVLDRGKRAIRPDELLGEVEAGALPQGAMVGPSAAPLRLREGVRAELDRIIGTNANDRAALARLIGTGEDWNPKKLAVLFGANRARALLRVLENEARYQRTLNDVVGGSQTAARLEAGRTLDAGDAPIPSDRTLVGLAENVARRGYRALAGNRSQPVRDELAPVLTATGAERDELVSQLAEAEARRRARLEMLRAAPLLGGRAAAAGGYGDRLDPRNQR